MKNCVAIILAIIDDIAPSKAFILLLVLLHYAHFPLDKLNVNSEFSTQTYAKCILAGEHTVIRGGAALVVPVNSCSMKLSFHPSQGGCGAEFTGQHKDDIHLLFWSVLEHGLELTSRQLSEIQGKFNLDNSVPVGTGLGASAALCVALTQWFIQNDIVPKNDLFSFAKRLEDLFHHKSSGLDIASVMSKGPITFQNGVFEPVEFRWKPHWKLSYSQQVGMTSHCVKKVNEFISRDPALGEYIDNTMKDAVALATEALQQNADIGLMNLAKAINQSRTCFEQWGLAGGRIQTHMNELLSHGALAVKPTGSGDGGYVLSLWNEAAHLPNFVEFIDLNA